MRQYLLLDTKNFLKPVGRITLDELMKLWKCKNYNQVVYHLNREHLIDDRYSLVEDQCDFREFKKINETINTIWYICNDGKIYSKNKFTGDRKELPRHLNKDKVAISTIHGKSYILKDLVACYFMKSWTPGCHVELIDKKDPYYVLLGNLKITD